MSLNYSGFVMGRHTRRVPSPSEFCPHNISKTTSYQSVHIPTLQRRDSSVCSDYRGNEKYI